MRGIVNIKELGYLIKHGERTHYLQDSGAQVLNGIKLVHALPMCITECDSHICKDCEAKDG